MGGACGTCVREGEARNEFEIPVLSHEEKAHQVVKIQRVFRGFLARKRVRQIRGMNSRHFISTEGDPVHLSPQDINVPTLR